MSVHIFVPQLNPNLQINRKFYLPLLFRERTEDLMEQVQRLKKQVEA